MKHISYILLLMCCTYNMSFAKKKKPVKKAVKAISATSNANVTFTFTTTSNYCGGAAPSEEMLNELKKPKANPNAIYFIIAEPKVSNQVKILATIASDADGVASLKLPMGKYYLINENQAKPLVIPPDDKFHTYNHDCLKRMWEKPLLEFVVSKTVNQINYNEVRKCSYQINCCRYTGPLPN